MTTRDADEALAWMEGLASVCGVNSKGEFKEEWFQESVLGVAVIGDSKLIVSGGEVVLR